ncbi:hypothetical protein [Streptomyces chrestomyceticus]|uniref:hypothetical protein n=1 Tax=Streptomyces chrestomyceticus TaxID=68185 RepID=UPI0037B294B6
MDRDKDEELLRGRVCGTDFDDPHPGPRPGRTCRSLNLRTRRDIDTRKNDRVTNTRWINVDPPANLAAAAMRRLVSDAGLEARQTNGVWRISVQENYRRTASPMLRSEQARVADPASFTQLTDLPDLPNESPSVIRAALDRVREEESPAALAAQFQLEFMLTPGRQLADTLRRFLTERASLLEGPASQLHIVLSDPSLLRRAQFPRILTSLAHKRDGLPALSGELGRLFPAAHALTDDVSFGALAFVLPALSACAPRVLGVPAARLQACGVWLFGRPLTDTAWPSSRLTDTLRPSQQSAGAPHGRTAALGTDQTAPFLRWWTQQCAAVLRTATDPTYFDDGHGTYVPSRHLAFLASLGRLYRDTAEAVRSSDPSSGLRAAYDALDCLEGMSWKTFDEAAHPGKAQKVVETLRQHLPGEVSAVALPLCERAARALKAVRDGFITDGRYYASGGLTGMPGKHPAHSMTWDKAVQRYVRLNRNSAHSYRKIEEDPFERALLFSHEGTMPGDLAYLPFLHLMDILASPQKIGMKLGRRAAKRATPTPP